MASFQSRHGAPSYSNSQQVIPSLGRSLSYRFLASVRFVKTCSKSERSLKSMSASLLPLFRLRTRSRRQPSQSQDARKCQENEGQVRYIRRSEWKTLTPPAQSGRIGRDVSRTLGPKAPLSNISRLAQTRNM